MPSQPLNAPLTCLALWMALLATGCSEKPAAAWSGYAEGDYVYISAPLAGRLEAVAVRAGQSIAKDAVLFSLDAEVERSARDEAAARLDSARAVAANTDKGRRTEEIALTQAQLAQAQASATLAQSDLARQQQLVTQGFVSKARLDDATTAVRQAQARVAELNAALTVARLPARVDERKASQAAATAALEVLHQSQWRTGQKQQLSPASALVADVFFRAGEWVPAGQPVLALLPPNNIKARFFVPEAEIAHVKAGQRVLLGCDGCAAAVAARVSHIATQAEYTPPVIYSNAQRAKLVFMVEAQPEPNQTQALHPGQPLDVRPVAAGSTP